MPSNASGEGKGAEPGGSGGPREVQEAAAFAPGHLTAFFEIHDAHPDPLRKGSRGAGVNLRHGVLSHVQVWRAEEQRVEVLIDHTASAAEVTAKAVRNLIGKTAVHVRVHSQVPLPVSQGFGMSGAGALSATMALGRALRLPKSDAVVAAHKAEVALRTGLGDVVAQVQGGIELRAAPGLPPWGRCQRVVGEGELVLCVLGGTLETRGVLEDQAARARIQAAGRKAIASFSEQPTIQNLFRLGKQFSIEAGLADEAVLRAIRAVEREGGLASQAMLGHSVFAYHSDPAVAEAALKDHGEVFRTAIEPTGARYAELVRDAPPPPAGSAAGKGGEDAA